MSDPAVETVLDSSAILAYLQREPGHEKVARCLNGGLVSAVNLCEAAAKLLEHGFLLPEATAVIDGLGLRVVPFGTDLAYRAAQFRVQTKAQGLSLGDRACLATAWSLGAPAITTDRAWLNLTLGVRVELSR